MLSVSTAWNYKENVTAQELLAEIKKTGVQGIELGYKLTLEQVEGILALLGQMQLKVYSIHNFCPLPYDGPSPRHPSNYYRLSAVDEDERLKAVKWTKNSIDVAVKVNASVVVIHAGTIEMDEVRLKQLLQMYREDKRNISEFDQFREELLAERRQKQPQYFSALIKSLDDLMGYAQHKGVKIGLETRYYLNEIPNCDEVGLLLDKYHEQGMYYWHDVGHAEVNERLGITPHMDFLKKYSSRMIGWHIHGVKIVKDHHAPFDGDFNLLKIIPYIKKHHIKVIESHNMATLAQMQKAVQTLSSVGSKI